MRFYLYLCTQKNKVINNLNITIMAQEKTIIGRFHIPDCEHRGDIEWGRNVVTRKLGGKVMITREYWDGKDCGTAYIEFCFPLSKLNFQNLLICLQKRKRNWQKHPTPLNLQQKNQEQ